MSELLEYAADCPRPDGLLSAAEGPWRLRNITAVRALMEPEDAQRRLRLWADVQLLGRAESRACLQVELCSEPWQVVAPGEGSSSAPAASIEGVGVGPVQAQPLAYCIAGIRATDGTGAGFWQQYLTPGQVQVPAATRQVSADDLGEVLRAALARWLGRTLAVTTVSAASEFADSGSVGAFGTVQGRVLERTAAADLAVDVTPLGEVTDADDHEGVAHARMALYGERHGRWLLHRCVAQPRKPRRNEAVLQPLYQCEVLVAESAAELVAMAGLGQLEKRLFQAAGVLPHATLADPTTSEANEEGATPQQLDISRVPDRSRRFLQAIAALAQPGGGLDATDLDVLLRVGRQIARQRRRPGK